MGLQFCRLWVCSTAVYVVENGVFHKNADGSTYVGGKQADVDVVTGAVEASEGRKGNNIFSDLTHLIFLHFSLLNVALQLPQLTCSSRG